MRDNTTTIEIDIDTHKNSRTYGGRNTSKQVEYDAADLCRAQQCDLEQLRINLINRGYDRVKIEESIRKIQDRNKELGITK